MGFLKGIEISDDGRTCTKCREFKSWDQFYDHSTAHRGKNPRCKTCVASHMRSWREQKLKDDPDGYEARRSEITRASRRGITVEELRSMYRNQHHRCAICGVREIDLPRRFAVDHNHVTGRVRGLLCDDCNKGLGLFRDDPERLATAISYLLRESRNDNH